MHVHTEQGTRPFLNQLGRFFSTSAWAFSLPGQISERKVAQRSLKPPWVIGDTRCPWLMCFKVSWTRRSFQECCPMELLRIGSFWAALLRNACWLTWQAFNEGFLYWSQLNFIHHKLVTDVTKSSQNSKGQMETSSSPVLQKDFHLTNTLEQQQRWLQS